MATVPSTALILHDDTFRQSRIESILRPRGLTVVGKVDAGCGAGLDEHRPIACAVVQLSRRGNTTTDQAISHLREQLGWTRIIALTPPGDVASARNAFRAGVWDCLEESVSDGELADRICDAWKSHGDPPVSHTTRPLADTILAQDSFVDRLKTLRSHRYTDGRPVSIIMSDIDRLSEFTATSAPAISDNVLEHFAVVLTSKCRDGIFAARYDRGRFAVALPESDETHAKEFARRLRQALGELPLVKGGIALNISLSAGIAESSVGFVETEHQLIERAEAAADEAKRRGSGQTITWGELLQADERRVEQKTSAAGDASRWVDRLWHHLRSTYVESTMALIAAVEAKDPCTQSHSLTVARYAEKFARAMKLPDRIVETVRVAALLHDIGKIGVPDSILTKPGPLTDAEFDVVKQHPEIALDILGHVRFLADVSPMILHHHEHFDGSGYPSRMIGDEIPIGARILCVADAIDAMQSPRSYKEARTHDQVRSELIRCSGSQFDPAIVEIALEWLDGESSDSITK